MSEAKKRTVLEIQQEYTNVCVKAGHLQYSIVTLQKDLAAVNDALRDLNIEGAAAQAAEAAEKAESEKKDA